MRYHFKLEEHGCNVSAQLNNDQGVTEYTLPFEGRKVKGQVKGMWEFDAAGDLRVTFDNSYA